MSMQTPEAAVFDSAALAEIADAAAVGAPRITQSQAVWIARIGRLAIVWLPVWAICVAQFPNPLRSLEASLVFTAIWKLALRRSFANTSITVWTFGSQVAAAVGAVSGAALVLALESVVPFFRVHDLGLPELALAVFFGSALWEGTVTGSLADRCRVLLVGIENGGLELLEELAQARRLPFHVIGVVDDERESEQVSGIPLHGKVAELAAIVERERPQIVVLADDGARDEALGNLIDASYRGFSVVPIAEFYEYAFGRLPVRNLNHRWFLSILDLYRRPYSQVAKRTFDVAVASVGLLLVTPLLPLVALLVRRTPGPVIFRQTRLGENGRTFTIYKFRTMRADAEAGGAMWACERDPRVTRVGCFLRKTRIDELPQLWNVLRGDMSIVGPRPERPEFVAELQDAVPYWTRRHLVKPGITGWAQIRRGYTADASGTADKLAYDLWYLRHRSLLLDVCICAKTFTTLVSGHGAR
jgi:exopolysaccharide biosynthesis polyprenyl glycosylphosphotransferase